jgi:KDO2-lipid IV(A) lauroyltransferase
MDYQRINSQKQIVFSIGNLMGIEVPVHGAEMLAKNMTFNVIFAKVKKVGRGYYECTLIPISDNPTSVPDFEITDAFIQEVENKSMKSLNIIGLIKDGNTNAK